MSEDDGDRKDSFHSQLQKTYSSTKLIFGAVISVVVVGFQSANFIDSLAKKAEIDKLREYIVSENLKQQLDIDTYKTLTQKYSSEIGAIKSALIQHMELYAGELAADRIRATRPSRVAQVAARAREKFRKSIASGRTIEQALYDSQDSSYWPFETHGHSKDDDESE